MQLRRGLGFRVSGSRVYGFGVNSLGFGAQGLTFVKNQTYSRTHSGSFPARVLAILELCLDPALCQERRNLQLGATAHGNLSKLPQGRPLQTKTSILASVRVPYLCFAEAPL